MHFFKQKHQIELLKGKKSYFPDIMEGFYAKPIAASVIKHINPELLVNK